MAEDHGDVGNRDPRPPDRAAGGVTRVFAQRHRVSIAHRSRTDEIFSRRFGSAWAGIRGRNGLAFWVNAPTTACPQSSTVRALHRAHSSYRGAA